MKITILKRILFKIGNILEHLLILPDNLRYFEYRHKYDIDKKFLFNGPGTLFYGEGCIVCGEKSYIGRFSQVMAYKGCNVVIGRFCEISHFVKIYTANNDPDQDMSKTTEKKIKTGDVIIGDHCWLGASVFINGGCTIGENSVVGANSVVTRDIPPHSIAVGAPARVIKFKSYVDDAQKKMLASEYRKSLSVELQNKYGGA